MNEIRVFDASALIALFRGREEVYRLITGADAGLDQVVWPACAIGEANTYLKGGTGIWEALLLGRITILDLTANGAIEAGLLTSHLTTGQVIHEASMTRGTVVTDDPDRYGPLDGTPHGAVAAVATVPAAGRRRPPRHRRG